MGISVSAALCPTGSQGVAAALPACLLGQSAHKLSSCWQRKHGAVETILGRQPGGKVSPSLIIPKIFTESRASRH